MNMDEHREIFICILFVISLVNILILVIDKWEDLVLSTEHLQPVYTQRDTKSSTWSYNHGKMLSYTWNDTNKIEPMSHI